jgi:hypothetical protein
MSNSDGLHKFNALTLVRRTLSPTDRRTMRRIDELDRHNIKVAIMRQDLSMVQRGYPK